MGVSGERLNKYLAAAGVCSRREADRLIDSGRVTVNGQKPQLGTQVMPGDRVEVDGQAVSPRKDHVVLAFYKPVGVTCSEKDAHAEKLVRDLIDYPVRVTYAGRLDKDSEGLLLLTDDGDLINAMMRGAARHEKEYIVRVDREVTESMLEKMQGGIYLKDLGEKTRPCLAEQLSKFTFRIVLTQGLNRQIRRMCEACGYHTRSLKRIRVMSVELGDLKPGQYRELTKEEQAQLYRLCGMK